MSFTSGIFVITGSGLIVFAILINVYDSEGSTKIKFRGEEYGIISGDWNYTEGKLEAIIANTIEENIQSSNESKELNSEQDNIDPIQFTIDELNKQIAVKVYQEDISDKEGLKIVDVEGTKVRAASENELDLTTGLMFNVFVDREDVSERIATAELTEAESTTGKLFEFDIIGWKYEDKGEIMDARSALDEDRGRMKIITDGVVDTDIEGLQEAREKIKQIKNKRDTKYETSR